MWCDIRAVRSSVFFFLPALFIRVLDSRDPVPIHRYAAIIFLQNAYPPLSGIKGESLFKAFTTLPYWKGSRRRRRRWWKTIAPFYPVCHTRKLVFLDLFFFVTHRLSQTAKNKRFETTSLCHTSELRRTHLCQIAGRIEWIVNPTKNSDCLYMHNYD